MINLEQLVDQEINQRLRDQIGAMVLNDVRLNSLIKVLTAQLKEKDAEIQKLRPKVKKPVVPKTNGAEHPVTEEAQREL